MQIIKKLLPHLTLALAIVLLVVVIVDGYNPRMGFLTGKPFQVLAFAEAICAIATALCSLFRSDRKAKRRMGKYEKE